MSKAQPLHHQLAAFDVSALYYARKWAKPDSGATEFMRSVARRTFLRLGFAAEAAAMAVSSPASESQGIAAGDQTTSVTVNEQ